MWYELVPATHIAAAIIAPALRPVDVAEIKAGSGEDPLSALRNSIDVSDEDMCWTIKYDGYPVGLCGVNRITDEIGGAWLLATPGIYANKRAFMRQTRLYLGIMHSRYEWLTNFIDERNLVTRLWLERLGWKPVQRIDEFGVGKLPFIQYVSRRK